MIGHPQLVMPGRSTPKLRSSCDGCGRAKLKCDRGQPECGRCLSYGMPCVYGFSRKMGKPARQRLLPTLAGDVQSRSRDGDPEAGGRGTNAGIRLDLDLDMDLDGFPGGAHEGPGAWNAVEDNTNPNYFAVNYSKPLDSLYNITSVGLTSLDVVKWEPSNDHTQSTNPPFVHRSTPTPESFGVRCYSSTGIPKTQVTPPHQSQADGDYDTDDRDHDCSREAYAIVEILSSFNLSNIRSVPGGRRASADLTAGQVPWDMPLDHILCLNREASERLDRLLTCPCARSSHLALLYASIISRVLSWYQQAAGCPQSLSWYPSAMTMDTGSHYVSPVESSPGSASGSTSWGGSCAWSSTAASTFSRGSTEATPALTQPTGLPIAPEKIAIGTFNVDDMYVQSALKIQLLLGEMRRAGCLIEQFIASHNSGGQFLADKATFGGVDSLYLSLDSWLTREHAMMTNMMRMKLSELNT